MTRFKMDIMTFMFGGVIYSMMEILFRGFTHWSMTITGGLCLLIMYRHFTAYPKENIFVKCLFGACIITALEFIAGCIVNLWLGWAVWDYSSLYMNILGQICLPFMALWYLVSFLGVWICTFLNNWFNIYAPVKQRVPLRNPAIANS